MIVTSDRTALMAIMMQTNTGKPTRARVFVARTAGGRLPTIRPMTTSTSTGMPIVANTPSGSRTKILISSQVRFHSPRSIVLVPYRMAGQLEEYVFERRQHRAEIGDRKSVV